MISATRSGDPADVSTLTAAINRMSPLHRLVSDMGLFNGQGIPTLTSQIDQLIQNHGIVFNTARGGDPIRLDREQFTNLNFKALHFDLQSQIHNNDAQDRRRFGSDSEFSTTDLHRERAQRKMRDSLEETMEFVRSAAVQGLQVDGSGGSLDTFFTVLGQAQKTVDFVLSSATENINAKLAEVRRHIQDNIGGDSMTGIAILASDGWWDDFTDHAKVVRTWEGWQRAGDERNRTHDDPFKFAKVDFHNYRGTSKLMKTGAVQPYLPADEAIGIPIGTGSMFFEFYSPSDFFVDANQIGIPFYSQEYFTDNSGKSLTVEAQTNPTVLNLRPELSVKITKT